MTGASRRPLNGEEIWINKNSSLCHCVLCRFKPRPGVCAGASVGACWTNVSVLRCLSLVQVLRRDNGSASLSSSLLARLSPLIQRATGGRRARFRSESQLFGARSTKKNEKKKTSSVDFWELVQTGSLNSFATADSSTL